MSKASKYKIEDTIVGNDVEFFLQDVDKKIVPAWDLIGGTKSHPLKVNGGYVSEDGISAEVSTTPAANEQEFVENLTTIITSLKEIVEPVRLKLLTSASVVLDKELLSNPSSKIVGCDEDYDPWGRKITINKRPTYARKDFRCSGGHVHVSHPIFMHDEWRRVGAQLFDIYLGLPAVLLDRDINRRSMYGNPGAHRPTSYPDGSCGIEYRVLSNFWVSSETLQRWVYRQTIRMVEDLLQREKEGNYKVNREDVLTYCISSGNIDETKAALKYFPSRMPEKVSA